MPPTEPTPTPAFNAAICCEGVTKTYGGVAAVDHLDLTVEQGEIVALLGPSGCGKTSLLRLIAGFERAEAGRITISGRSVADAQSGHHAPPESRHIGMVFQDYALFPHLSVSANVGYGLGRRPNQQRVDEVLELVGLSGLGHRRPDELSGGQQQRVALARALAPSPDVVLLDEPFSNLDAALRTEVRGEVRRLLQEAGVSALLVTHDQDEALSVADRVAVMRAGRIEQVGVPEQVYLAPESRWVGAFLGEINVMAATAAAGRVTTLSAIVETSAEDGPVDVLVRPESIALDAAGSGGVPGVICEREYFGHDQLMVVELADGVRVRSRQLGYPRRSVGDRIEVRLAGPVTVLPRPSLDER